MIKYTKIKHRFDVSQMQREVKNLESGLWKPHYNEKRYEGDWTILPLRSINGSVDNCVSLQGSSLQKNLAYMDTCLLGQCTYLQSVISFFECEKMSVRLMKLDAGAFIKEHTDFEMCFEEGEARFHVPILSNPDVDFFIEDERIPMKEGECWYLNLSLKHRVNNPGDTSRIHLVIDCKVNDLLRKLLKEDAELVRTVSDYPPAKCYNDPEKNLIIQQLRLMGTAVSNELADKLEAGNHRTNI